MPLYEFRCDDCAAAFEELMSFAELQAGAAVCPACGSRRVRRHLSPFATGGSARAGAAACDGGGCGGAFP